MITTSSNSSRINRQPASENFGSRTETCRRESQAAEAIETVEKWMGDHPVVCVAVGIALGVTVGWLIKRK